MKKSKRKQRKIDYKREKRKEEREEKLKRRTEIKRRTKSNNEGKRERIHYVGRAELIRTAFV